MDSTIQISAEERKELQTGKSMEVPKYSSSVLTDSIRWSGANSFDVIGNLNDIYDEFEEKHSDADYQDWERFYVEQYNGDERLEEGTERAYQMLQNIRDAIADIEHNQVHEFLEELVLYQTYRGQNIRSLIIELLNEKYIADVKAVDNEPVEAFVHAFADDVPVSIQPESAGMSGKSAPAKEDPEVAVVYYRENSADSGLRINIEELNRALSPIT
ncbi:MjaI family restriction endonuclease [Haloarchaeobius litoreus]|uniref:MjaI family restriction endonuclease n=1 Tax=Haloarchaeobius litoreus TaxID=755306 RepID=A0ABD6DJL4_9EURY|nr:MjaI family restriction endonuclease [Haloarchaeobius litoreus]